MNYREAYRVLILGRLSRDYAGTWEKIRHHILWDDYTSPVKKYGLSREDVDLLRVAAGIKSRITPSYTQGIRTFGSIFEMLLFEESVLYFGGWQHMDNGFRGHLNWEWVLAPTLSRVSSGAEAHIAHTVSVARHLLAERSPVKHLPAIKLLGVLQHYGLMTPLLDFTTNIQVAAAFACRSYGTGAKPAMGSILKASAPDFERFVNQPGTALGERLSFTVDEVPRIRNQKGIFFVGFKVGFLETLTSVERCYFQHGPDTAAFANEVGLTEDVLFPPADAISSYVQHSVDLVNSSGSADVVLTLQAEEELHELTQILVQGYRANTLASTTEDYLSLAKGWIDWPALPERQRHEIRIFTQWFSRLKQATNLNLPLSCLTLMRLKHAVEAIAAFDESAENSTDIFDRLTMHGQDSKIPELRRMFHETRASGNAAHDPRI